MFKQTLNQFISNNPFPQPYTQGFFYREKMRAIHSIAPDQALMNILEVGGGQSGLTALLYPQAKIVNVDLNAEYANAACNQQKQVQFVCGDATHLPFEDRSFDAVTMFDLLEHVPDHKQAISEALRVLKPNGCLLVSTPNENWRFPYYSFMKPYCPSESEIMAEWGHVRRGYTLDELKALINLPCVKTATFINQLTILTHDVAFSKLSPRRKEVLYTFFSPLKWLGYYTQPAHPWGTETASLWQKID